MTRTFEARYVLEANGSPPPLGASIRVELPRPEGARSGLAVPIGALVERGGGAVVFVVDQTRRVVHRRPVTVAALGEETVQVSAGLAAGETVVSLGANQLQDGQAIRLEPRP
jgi:multidrug efflux pump subunit AcrA (membrane-fusion protein)